MSLFSYPLRLVDGFVDRVFAVAGALVFSQYPAFIAHYVQRLAGHAAEAGRNVAGWQKIADTVSGGSLDQMVRIARTEGGPFSGEAAGKCATDLARLDHLLEALDAIRNAPVWKKGLVFLRHLDADIARAAFKDFVPNVALDAESLGYALAGMILAVLLYRVLKVLVRISYLAMRRPKTPVETAA